MMSLQVNLSNMDNLDGVTQGKRAFVNAEAPFSSIQRKSKFPPRSPSIAKQYNFLLKAQQFYQ
jgi:hypothetical protein